MNFLQKGIHSIRVYNSWSKLINFQHQIRSFSGFVNHTEQDVDYFKKILGTNGVKQEELDVYNKDWLHSVTG